MQCRRLWRKWQRMGGNCRRSGCPNTIQCKVQIQKYTHTNTQGCLNTKHCKVQIHSHTQIINTQISTKNKRNTSICIMELCDSISRYMYHHRGVGNAWPERTPESPNKETSNAELVHRRHMRRSQAGHAGKCTLHSVQHCTVHRFISLHCASACM